MFAIIHTPSGSSTLATTYSSLLRNAGCGERMTVYSYRVPWPETGRYSRFLDMQRMQSGRG
jgi:hypothetical protein